MYALVHKADMIIVISNCVLNVLFIFVIPEMELVQHTKRPVLWLAPMPQRSVLPEQLESHMHVKIRYKWYRCHY